MDEHLTISESAARHLQLAAQGLLVEPDQPAVKTDVHRAIRQMGALQIDTIHVVARSPYMVLWSRLGDYDPHWLDELLVEGELFEYWSHAACFLPVEDFPQYRRLMIDNLRGWGNNSAWLETHPALVEQVLDRIAREGPLKSSDFIPKNGRSPKSGWWDWKEEKIALDRLHTAGSLMIRERRNFQRVYDLTARVLPGWNDDEVPPFETVRRFLTLKAVRAMGIARASWVPDYFRLPRVGNEKVLQELASQGELLQAKVEGWDEPVFFHPANLVMLQDASNSNLTSELTTLLSPFDPLVWDRVRCRHLFKFDFSLECYLPSSKRRFGYFLLPVLHRGSLVGRLDAKAHRSSGVFEVKNLYLEPETILDDQLSSGMAEALRRCARWHRTPDVQINNVEPPVFMPILKRAVNG